jgi:hypothetical protein
MLLPSRDQPLLNVCATGHHKHHDQGRSRIPGPHHARDQHVLSHAEASSSGSLALCAVDGGDEFVVDQSAASSILAMLGDPKYLEKVKQSHEERYG